VVSRHKGKWSKWSESFRASYFLRVQPALFFKDCNADGVDPRPLLRAPSHAVLKARSFARPKQPRQFVKARGILNAVWGTHLT